MGVAYYAPFARPQCLAAIYSSSPEVGNGLSWPKPQCTCNAMVTSQAQHSTNEGVLRSNSACSMLMRDDLRLPRRGIEPRPPGFRQVDCTARPLPLPNDKFNHNHIHNYYNRTFSVCRLLIRYQRQTLSMDFYTICEVK